MQRIVRTTVAVASSLSIAAAGLVGAVGASSIHNTGPSSWNKVENSTHMSTDIDNDNNVNVHNSNGQDASSGYAGVKHNTTGGDATSGAASNDNAFTADLSIDNSGAGCGCVDGLSGGSQDGTIDTTGPNSNNKIENSVSVHVDVNNDNDVNVSNYNHQDANSGDASVWGNTTGGNATSGDATNTNSSSVTLSITN